MRAILKTQDTGKGIRERDRCGSRTEGMSLGVIEPGARYSLKCHDLAKVWPRKLSFVRPMLLAAKRPPASTFTPSYGPPGEREQLSYEWIHEIAASKGLWFQTRISTRRVPQLFTVQLRSSSRIITPQRHRASENDLFPSSDKRKAPTQWGAWSNEGPNTVGVSILPEDGNRSRSETF
jgi:hypothetical protein